MIAKLSGTRADVIAISLLKIAFAFFVSLKLSLLPHDIFIDRENYLVAIANSEQRFFGLLDSQVPLLVNEPLFELSNYLLGFLLQPESLLSFYVFVNCFVVLSFVLLNRVSIVYSVLAFFLLLAIPYFYGGTMGAVRQGLGLNLILISLMGKNALTSKSFLFSLFIASLFHVIFFVFLSMALFYKIAKSLVSNDKLILLLLFVFVLVLGVGWRFITPFLSESQSYSDFDRTTNGFSIIGWAVIFFLLACSYFNLKRRGAEINESLYLIAFLMFVCFLVFYWLAPGPYRILYSCTPIFVCALMHHFNIYSSLCYVVAFLYGVVLLYLGVGSGSMNVSFGQFLSILF